MTGAHSVRRAGLMALMLAATLLAACGGGGKQAAQTSTTTTSGPSTQTSTTQTTTTGIDVMKGASTNPVVVKGTNKETALLSDVRAARHEGFDRVVFEFQNVLPGYSVHYVDKPIHQDGSGKVIDVGGAFVVEVRMETALDADLTKPSAPRTYTGPLQFSPGTPEVAQLVRVGGFEGVLTWAVGLQDRVDFRVSTMTGPPRLVVDFRNH